MVRGPAFYHRAMETDATTSARKIIHVDMDAFYASVEQRDDPTLRGKPVAVGGSSRRGVVAAASYEARAFGVRSAMPGVTARRRCPSLIFVKPRFDVYRSVSQQVRDIFARYTKLMEPLSLDEAYLDVTNDDAGIGSATATAERIRREIREELGLTASAGVSYNKFIAKVASDQNKPDGICIVRPGQGAEFVASLPARRFFGVGPRTAERMASLGIHTGADLRDCTLGFLEQHFGKSARYLFHASRGDDDRPVRRDRQRKSIGGERTYGDDLRGDAELMEALTGIVEIVWPRIEGLGASGRTVTLKMKFADFRQITRSRTEPMAVSDLENFERIARDLLRSELPVPLGVRLLGLTLSSLEAKRGSTGAQEVSEPEPAQQPLF